MVAGFIPEQWPASNRNSWPASVGIINPDHRPGIWKPVPRCLDGCMPGRQRSGRLPRQ